MDLEHDFISAIARNKAMREATAARVSPDWFSEHDHRTVWGWMLDYWRDYGTTPTAKAIVTEFPHYRLVRTEEPVEYWIDLFVSARKFRLLQEGFLGGIDKLQEDRDIAGAQAFIADMLVKVGLETSRTQDVNIIATYKERMEHYRSLIGTKDGLLGIPLGFASLDRALAGATPGQLITMIGLPKGGKSSMLLHSSLFAHNWGKRPLFVTFEMSNEEQLARLDAMVAKIDHHKLRTGQLDEESMQRLEDALEERAEMHDFVMSADVSSLMTVSGLRAKIVEYQPDIVLVDGAYLMEDERGEAKGSPQALTNITRDLKRLAQTADLPIVITTQVLESKYSKKRGLTASSIGYSSSFVQDSDAIIGVEHTDDDSEKIVSIVEARNAPHMKVMVRWDWATMTFEEYAMSEDAAVVGGQITYDGYVDYADDVEEEVDEAPAPRRRRRRRAS